MMMDLPSAFMLQQALPVQTLHREGAFMKSVMAFVIGASVLLPAQAFARDSDSESAICTDPKHRHTVVRPLTEPAPVRKKDKLLRIRRVLM
jgi:hypothetical protein